MNILITGSKGFVGRNLVAALGLAPKMVLSSSIQAELDNPYGVSKRNAEEVIRRFAVESGATCVVHRFKNLFGNLIGITRILILKKFSHELHE